MAPVRAKNQAQKKRVTDDLSARLVTVTSPDDAASEAYRSLRTNLLYALAEAPPKAIAVTSPGPTEGKTTTCVNLGVVLAQAGKDVLVLDCDLRQPTIHKLFGLRSEFGLVDVLIVERKLQEILQEPLPGLKVGPVGSVPSNPAELLGSKRFAGMLNQARQDFDYVIMDGPPTHSFTESMILSALADGVLLVIDSQSTRKGSVQQSLRSLNSVGANVLGTVMNNVKPSADDYYYGYRNYSR